MKISKYLASAAFGFLTLTVASCQSDKTETAVITEFPVEQKLDTICTVTPEYSEHLTNSINTAGDFFVSVNFKSPYLLSVYDQKYELADTIVPKGHGHNEMMSALYFGQWEGKPGNPSILVFEPGANKILKLHAVPYSDPEPVAELPAKMNLSPSRIFLNPDSTLVGINLAAGGQSTLFRYGISDQSLAFSKDSIPFNPEDAFFASQCGLAVSGDGTSMATAYLSIPMICLYDKGLSLRKKIFIGSEIDTSTVKTGDSNNGFVNIEYAGDKIVALYMDVKEQNANRLMVFDKDGNPEGSFNIGNSIGFCLDRKNGRILSLDYDGEAGLMKFYIYEMPALLKNN